MKEQKIIKVAGYIRISTDEEHQPYSLSAQEERIKEYVRSRKKESYRLFKIYSDQKSAATLDRPALKDLLKDAEKGLFDMVLIVKMDRLWRNLADQLYLTEQFQKLGIKLEATDENIDLETPDGITWAQIRGALNEAERRKISYRTKMGMRKKASSGEWCGGYTPFGYSYNKLTKTLAINEDEVSTVKEIFYLYVTKKLGAKSIATYLNRKGIRTRGGYSFSTSRIISIITNPVYTGKIKWDGEIYSGTHEAIVDEKTFNEAQAILNTRRGNPSLRRSNSSCYLLSGLLYCEMCGRHMVGVNAHGRNDIYRYYACPGRFKYGECAMQSLPKEKVEKAILSQIKDIFRNETILKRICKRVRKKMSERIPKKKAELKNLEKEILKRKNIIQRYLLAFEAGKMNAESCNERVKELEEEIYLLKEKHIRLQEEIGNSETFSFNLEEIKKVIDKLEEVILSGNPSEGKAFLRRIIKKIKVHSPCKIEPYYRIPAVCIMSGVAPPILQL